MARRTHSLQEYQQKRDFSKTPEPSGEKKPSSAAKKIRKELFFCVQKHLASHLHYDFRLEHAGVLLSWAVPKGPSLRTADKRLAMRVEDHPFDYGEFEGVIPEGYGAGVVMLWDRGTWEPEADDIDAALEKGELKFRLNGVKLKGNWVMVRTSRPGAGLKTSWMLIKRRDEWAGDVDIATFAPNSVKSGRDFEAILLGESREIWHSHKPGDSGESGAAKTFRRIAEKIAALKESEGKGAPARATTVPAPRAAGARTKPRLPKPAKPGLSKKPKRTPGAARTQLH